MEWSGKHRCVFIDKILYNYVEHESNSWKTVSPTSKAKQVSYISGLTPKKEIVEDIHVVMCCWKRTHNLEAQLESMNNQTVARRIVYHLLNNNPENVTMLENLVFKLRKVNTHLKNIVLSHYDNTYFGFQRFKYIVDVLVKKYNFVDYVIFIDDDQLLDSKWIENVYGLKAPRTYVSWYCKKWTMDHLDYWTKSTSGIGSDTVSSQMTSLHYGGTGGSIIDINVFTKTSALWNVPKDLPVGVSIYNIEDLWLSFVVRRIYHWTIHSHSFKPKPIEDDTNSNSGGSVALWEGLKKEKQLLFVHLVKMFGLED